MDVSIPEVQAIGQTVEFYKKDGIDYATISFVGMKDNVIKKVTPEIMGKFKPQWDAYCDGVPIEQRKGSPLTDIVQEERAKIYIQKNVHNIEELAVLSDAQCQSVGHGTLTDRKTAMQYLQQKKLAQFEATRKAIERAAPTIRSQDEQPQESEQVKQLSAKVDALTESVAALAQTLQATLDKPKRGRPPKQKAEE